MPSPADTPITTGRRSEPISGTPHAQPGLGSSRQHRELRAGLYPALSVKRRPLVSDAACPMRTEAVRRHATIFSPSSRNSATMLFATSGGRSGRGGIPGSPVVIAQLWRLHGPIRLSHTVIDRSGSPVNAHRAVEGPWISRVFGSGSMASICLCSSLSGISSPSSKYPWCPRRGSCTRSR